MPGGDGRCSVSGRHGPESMIFLWTKIQACHGITPCAEPAAIGRRLRERDSGGAIRQTALAAGTHRRRRCCCDRQRGADRGRASRADCFRRGRPHERSEAEMLFDGRRQLKRIGEVFRRAMRDGNDKDLRFVIVMARGENHRARPIWCLAALRVLYYLNPFEPRRPAARPFCGNELILLFSTKSTGGKEQVARMSAAISGGWRMR